MSKNILLFPGGFKPVHDGHLSILESHISNIDNVHIDEVRIYISPKDRDCITADTSLWFFNNIKDTLSNLYNVNIITEISNIPSPVGKCYNDVSTSLTLDKFCMVSSNKDSDIIRKEDFIKTYHVGGRKYDSSKGEQTIYINADIEPVYYNGRIDSYNGLYVSSTIVRQDLRNRDFKMFTTAYKHMLDSNILPINILEEYYNILIKLIQFIIIFVKDK